jgi:hypothetical protein
MSGALFVSRGCGSTALSGVRLVVRLERDDHAYGDADGASGDDRTVAE